MKHKQGVISDNNDSSEQYTSKPCEFETKLNVFRRTKSLSCTNFSKLSKKTCLVDKHKKQLYIDSLIQCTSVKCGCSDKVHPTEMHEHLLLTVQQQPLISCLDHYNLPIHHPMHKAENANNIVQMPADLSLTLPSCPSTMEFESPLPYESAISDLHVQNKEIYETLTILTGGIQTLREDSTKLTDKFSELESNINKYCQEQMKLKQSVEEQYTLLSGMQMNQQILEQELTTAKQNVENVKYTTYDGTSVWKIKNVTQLMYRAQCESQPSIYSSPFYSSSYGYKMCMRLYMNGDGNAKRTHISLFFVLMRGEYDAILKWPFHFKVTFCLMDQSGKQQHIIDSFRPDIKSNSFQIPKTSMNIASGIPKFFPLSALQQDGNNYVKDDTMFIRCIVDFNEMPKMILPYSLSLNLGLPDHIQKLMIKAEIQRRQQSSILQPQITKPCD
ncbi:unnamed protein product [Didymodactylos carnosus]|uniref:MATH domain-containing protein n=1 Tax=Didymodactylos carnosus TaxID=1234261 RepID=A0A814JKS0_9BILA